MDISDKGSAALGVDDAPALSQAEIGKIFDSISQYMIRILPDGKVVLWSKAAEEMLHVEAADALGKRLDGTGVKWDWEKVTEGLARCLDEKESVRLEDLAFKNPDGEERFLSMTLIPMRNQGGELSGVVLLGYDFTQRKILEITLAENQKIESIGQLAGSIAQEINSPIQYIGDNVRFLQGAFEDLSGLMEKYQKLLSTVKNGTVSKEIIEEVEETLEGADWDYLSNELPNALDQTMDGVNKVTNTVQAIKDFSQPASEDKVAVDFNRVVESTILMARNDWKHVAELSTDLEAGMPNVRCHRAQVNQVIMHLVRNAAEAIAEKVGDDPKEKGMIRISTRSDRRWAEFCISDTGCGITEEVRPKIFDPFFTTKDGKNSVGEGLALCKSVVEDNHGGTIRFESVPSTGTIFIIRLPFESE